MRAIVLATCAALVALSDAAWTADNTVPANAQAKKQISKAAPSKQVQPPLKKKSGNAQTQALDEATRMESRKHDTLSKSSKSRHGESKNAVRNER